jgi:hypothetical protein
MITRKVLLWEGIFMGNDVCTKQLMAEQTLGFVLTMLYFKEVREKIGTEKALTLLGKAAIERRKSWYLTVKTEVKNSHTNGTLKSAADFIVKFWIEATPKDISKELIISEKNNEIVIESSAWCPICEAADMLGLDKTMMCNTLGVKADEWLARQIVPKAKIIQSIALSNVHREIIRE